MADATPTSGAPSSNRTVMIILSYLWLLALVPLLVEKEDREVQWHAKHGLVLMLAEVIFWIVVTFLQVILGAILGCFVGLISMLLWIGILILHILAIIKGVNGQRLIVPEVSQYADKF